MSLKERSDFLLTQFRGNPEVAKVAIGELVGLWSDIKSIVKSEKERAYRLNRKGGWLACANILKEINEMEGE